MVNSWCRKWCLMIMIFNSLENNRVAVDFCPVYNLNAGEIDLVPCDLQRGICSSTDFLSHEVYRCKYAQPSIIVTFKQTNLCGFSLNDHLLKIISTCVHPHTRIYIYKSMLWIKVCPSNVYLDVSPPHKVLYHSKPITFHLRVHIINSLDQIK